MDEEEYTAAKQLLNRGTGAILTTKLRLLAVKDVERMTLQECCTSLDDWKDTYNELKVTMMHTSDLFLNSEDVYKNLYQQWELRMNINQVYEDILKLIKLLDKKKKSFGLVLKGKFGKNVQALMSGFEYVAQDYDVKDHSKVQVDLQYLAGDPTLRKDVMDGLFDDDISNDKTPFDHSIMKQEPASKPDDCNGKIEWCLAHHIVKQILDWRLSCNCTHSMFCNSTCRFLILSYLVKSISIVSEVIKL